VCWEEEEEEKEDLGTIDDSLQAAVVFGPCQSWSVLVRPRQSLFAARESLGSMRSRPVRWGLDGMGCWNYARLGRGPKSLPTSKYF
jgi:hypothetical protein